MKKVALFDFDNTLIIGDSLWPFLICATGPIMPILALIEGLIFFSLYRVQKKKIPCLRTFIKAHLLHRLLRGKKRSDLVTVNEKILAWQNINVPVMRLLFDHHTKGDIIVIASGGLDLYLPDLLREVPYDALICTEIGINNGIITGTMINGNCVRQCKADRVAEWLATHGPFDESFGYGNYPHDIPMLNLVKYRIII